ncbi:MAG: GNAT family N-acetyltransferase [Lachnospiraceae bacterium]|nr:GNAT family N-acetyltransferase [Lachnospiraceae bacterium]
MIHLVENALTVDEQLYLRQKVGWKPISRRQSKLSLENCLFNVKAVDDMGNVVGMGRIVGDGAVISYIQDLIVIPEVQKQGVGSMIIERLIQYVESIREKDTTMMLCLMCAKGREKFYINHGFIPRPTDGLGPGMIQYME